MGPTAAYCPSPTWKSSRIKLTNILNYYFSASISFANFKLDEKFQSQLGFGLGI
jgi:hypothetical protein